MPRVYTPKITTPKGKAPKPKAPKAPKRKAIAKRKPVVVPSFQLSDTEPESEPDTDDTVPVVRDKPPGPPKIPKEDLDTPCITVAAEIM